MATQDPKAHNFLPKRHPSRPPLPNRLDQKVRQVILYILAESCFLERRHLVAIAESLQRHRADVFLDSGHHTPPRASPTTPTTPW